MIRIGILGYGNLGKGVELAVKNNPDIELIGIFTRRDPLSIKSVIDFIILQDLILAILKKQ